MYFFRWERAGVGIEVVVFKFLGIKILLGVLGVENEGFCFFMYLDIVGDVEELELGFMGLWRVWGRGIWFS